MKIHSAITINGVSYPAGTEISWLQVYPFFLVHMAMFGGSGFFMAYGAQVDQAFLYAHGGIAIFVYLMFYLTFFGHDAVKWMFINAGLGLLGIYAQIGWILELFGREIGDFPWQRHIIPFLYYVLYTFLLWQMVLDLTQAREDPSRRRRVEFFYVVLSVMIYLAIAWL